MNSWMPSTTTNAGMCLSPYQSAQRSHAWHTSKPQEHTQCISTLLCKKGGKITGSCSLWFLYVITYVVLVSQASPAVFWSNYYDYRQERNRTTDDNSCRRTMGWLARLMQRNLLCKCQKCTCSTCIHMRLCLF